MEKKKKVIWSLFDSETAITQDLNSDDYIVYSIGLPSSSAISDNFIKMDLSKRNCIKKLEKLPKPDIVFSSPPCETWVSLSIGNVRFYKRNFNEYNMYWQKNFKPNNFCKSHRNNRILGQKTAYFTAIIIKKFNPGLWCIENGSSSLIFKYLNLFHGLEGFENKCFYQSYDKDFTKKPTTFLCNKKMILKKINDNKNKNRICMDSSLIKKERDSGEWKKLGYNSPSAFVYKKYNIRRDYCERSAVPIQLYRHILDIYEDKEQLSLF